MTDVSPVGQQVAKTPPPLSTYKLWNKIYAVHKLRAPLEYDVSGNDPHTSHALKHVIVIFVRQYCARHNITIKDNHALFAIPAPLRRPKYRN